ncbi:MAG: rRNA pseudouridine synthase [Deltaproteobacteria bacterium]|nr:rRNA pseudouridine synthase [Deltaproteobacteria bacterium]
MPDQTKKTPLLKFLLSCGVMSRRKLVKAVLDGKVTVNKSVVKTPDFPVNPSKDIVRYKDKILKQKPKGVAVFYKPAKVLTTLSDPLGRPTVADYLPKTLHGYFPVGRLDYWSTGLVVLTNDGDLAYHLLHPKFQVSKTYDVKVSGILEEKDLRKLRKGLIIDKKLIKFDEIKVIQQNGGNTWLRITLHSGENRVIRKCLEKIFHPVLKLKRVKMGPFSLKNLIPGELRVLPEKEYIKLKSEIMRKTQNQEKVAN